MIDTVDIRARPARRGRSLGSDLERQRLERRVARVRQVIGALRERAETRPVTPPPLAAAIRDFGQELGSLERRLRLHDERGAR
jgi:hypothetical protein